MSYEDLARTLRTYGFQPDADALRSAFSQGPEASEWVRRHLMSPETLLARDELDQYAALVKSGAADRLASELEHEGRQSSSSSAPQLQQGPRVVAVGARDADLRIAIDELNRATAAVTRQTEALRQQHDALERLFAQDARAADARAKAAAVRARHAAAEKRRLAAEAEGLAQTLGGRVVDFEGRRNRGQGGGLQQTIDGLLRSDDKLLASLQKLGWELEADDPDEQEGVVKARETCARLIKYTVETLRTKLDRLYLEALEEEDGKVRSSADSQPRRQVPKEEIEEMQAELEELYTEILPVAQMSVEQQFLEPAVQSLAGRSASNLTRSVEALDYIDACLNYLLHNMTALSSRVEDYKAHESATATLLSAAKAELSSQITTATPSKAHGRTASLPAAASPIRPRRANTTASILNSNSSGADHQDQEPALPTLLRTLALTLPDDPSKDAAALSAALHDRSAKAADMARNVQASFEGSVAAHVVDAATAVANLRDSVLAETAAAPTAGADGSVVALTDPETESFIWMLQQEVGKVRGRLADVEADIRAREGGAGKSRPGQLGRESGGKREELIRRWGSAR
ncbi:hypothetical protein MCOR27_000488 [Pyricularia oryzae]|uniref:Uncharacterized protein n=1 Tax=Pyricularia grisea TaxID=148305 RepID=A0ABQ8NIF7_PYRGI|nr:hypothetical protein MCOR01_000089 [Pyricularia oryzae]KAI6296276.1 hypothetical protein MCOR33_007081 [Pyricularia grisea]KAI6285757.1 hypothetical protein MCOR26_001395 [Pyricularia oryzae]KAI6289171.1 hypothetical protein MCOR27_000488 [Pyricularia oryzae]KAI6336123.1 hypothetical protein MCOR29_000284 [Pyricularia oryzae]